MNAEPKTTKKWPPDCNPKRPNINLSYGGTLVVFVPRRKFLATAMPQPQGTGENAKRHARAI